MKILVALDLSESSRVIIDYVKGLGSVFPENIWLLHVAEPDPDFVGYDVDPTLMRDQTAKKYRKEHKKLQQLRRKLSASGTNCTSLLIQGSIVETILSEAVKLSVNMIIVGAQRKKTVTSLILGSTCRGVLHKSRIPVLVIPASPKKRA